MVEHIQVGVVGATGRMGSRVLRLIQAEPPLKLSSVLERNPSREGIDSGTLAGIGSNGVHASCDPVSVVRACDVLIDFSAPPACALLAPICAEETTGYVCASTGLTEDDDRALRDAAPHTAVLVAANLSVGVNVVAQLVANAATQLGEAFDMEVFELHHKHKRDAPSGTAYALGEAIREVRPELIEVDSRSGSPGPREDATIGYSAARGGDVAGEHTVFFLGEGERIEITHRSTTPDIFARGALRAARWLWGKEPGRYEMRDVLGG